MGIKDQPVNLGPVYEPVGGAPARATPYNSHPKQPFGASGGSPPRATPYNIHPLASALGWLTGYLLNALGFNAVQSPQTLTAPDVNLAYDFEGKLQDYGGAVNSDGILVAPVPGSRLSAGVVYDTDDSGNQLQPYLTGGVKDYQFYPLHAVSTAYAEGVRVSAVADDGLKHYFESSGGTSGGSAPTFPASGTVVDNDITWTELGLHTMSGQQIQGAITNKTTCVKANPADTTNLIKSGDAAATLTVVDDTAELTAAGLIEVCTNGDVYKLDNSGGSADAYATMGGSTGGTTEHTGSIHARGSGDWRFGYTNQSWDEFVPLSAIAGSYQRYSGTASPTASVPMGVRTTAGSIVYFILPGLYEIAVAPPAPVIGNDTAAAQTMSAVNDVVATSSTGITAEEGAGRIIVTPLEAGQTGKAFSSYTDADNQLSVDCAATAVTLNKEIATTIHTASKSYTHAADEQVVIDWSYGSGGMSVNAFVVGSTAGAAGTDADTSDAVLGTTVQVGAANNADHFRATYDSVKFFKNAAEAADKLEDWSL